MASNAMYSDVDINLAQQTDGDVLRDDDLDAIKNSIINIVCTPKGSRRMLPEFGADLRQFLFEPMDKGTARTIGGIILDEIERWETRIIIDNVDLLADYDNMQYRITITFHIKGLGELGRGTVKFVLKQS